jgi:hypothetical protein
MEEISSRERFLEASPVQPLVVQVVYLEAQELLQA